MKWIGLTGGIGSGKSTLTKMIRDKGFKVIDADELSHLAISLGTEGYQKVLQYFGNKILLDNQEINRKELAALVFSDPCKIKILEGIVHPIVQQQVSDFKNQCINANEKIAFYDVPLLFEKGMELQFDYVLLVSCERSEQIRRIKKRNNWSDQEIEARISSQMDLKSKERKASFVIQNNGSIQDLELELEKILKLLS